MRILQANTYLAKFNSVVIINPFNFIHIRTDHCRFLYVYFKRTDNSTALPDPKGQLSNKVLLGFIVEANKEVVRVITTDEVPQKKCPYLKVTPECKAKIAKFSINRNSVAARKYRKLVGKSLNESTVCSWVKTYKLELEHKRKADKIDMDTEA